MPDPNQASHQSKNIKAVSQDINSVMALYLSNTLKLEDISKIIPVNNETNDIDGAESDLMSDQEKLIEKLIDCEINCSRDASIILNIWAKEEVNPHSMTNQERLVMNVKRYLDDLPVN